jgi:hypothetical protein
VKHAGGVVEDLADIGAAGSQLGPGRIDVGDNELQALRLTDSGSLTEPPAPGQD